MEAFKQPQLGQTIVSLRNEKKLTQEELVERCNLNVRTLQRIEAGEVTPRDYTVRAILTALEYDIQRVEKSFTNKLMLKKVKYAWIAGIAYFLIGFAEGVADYLRFDDVPVYFELIYTGIKTLMIVTSIIFFIGFIEIGNYYKNSLLKITAYLMMGSLLIIELYDIISLFSTMTGEEFVFIKGVESVAFGGIDIFFGIALIQMRKELGNSALAAGIMEILVGIFFLTFILALVGLLFMIPAIILEVIILFKFYDLLKNE